MGGSHRYGRTGLLIAVVVGGFAAASPGSAQSAAPPTRTNSCPTDDSGLNLPPGFCATIFADGIGHARHLVVAPNGVVYVNTWSGRYYGNDTPHSGGFLVALQDTTGKGKADITRRFGATARNGGAGGTGIGLYRGALFAESNDEIVRYPLSAGAIVPKDPPVPVVTGLPLGGDHPMHPFAIAPDGSLYIDVATATNACQVKNRIPDSPGRTPCTELETRGGIWRYDANKANQVFSPAERFATGIRNAEGFAIDAAGRIFVTQHGRDQLHANWPALYKPEEEATLPAEELLLLKQGGDYGWPECYFDGVQGKLVLAPEYGGDGGNRAPYPQAGYNVVFQALSGDHASSRCEIFAQGFAGAVTSPGGADHRPSGIAVGPDGSLYVSDDVRGRIYRIVYRGGSGTAADAEAFVPCPSASEPAGPIRADQAKPPEGTHPDAGAADATAALPVPVGATREMVALGERIYHGQVGGATCTGCHGADAKGTPLAPNLTDTHWLWSDGSYPAIVKTITAGVPQPKQYRSPMPPLGGAQLTPDQVSAVAAYIWALSHRTSATAGTPAS
jgi:glucose/arabinose dehydrogenase/mono/diheme cytochrome c family protein